MTSSKKIASTHTATKLVSILLKMFDGARFIEIEVDAVLQHIAECSDRVSSILFAPLSIMVIQKCFLVLQAILHLKFFPAGIVLYWLGVLISSLGVLTRIGKFFVQPQILILLFILATSYVNHTIKYGFRF